MADLSYLFDRCSEWAKETDERIGSGGIFIFGSTINQDGDQFIEHKSDIDLVIVFPRTVASAPARVEWLQRLLNDKHALELSLIPVLERTDAGKPIVSVLAVTEHEILADVHKSPAPNFFRSSDFKSLLNPENPATPLLQGDPAPISNPARQAVQLAQAIRNKYLGASAARKIAIKPWDDEDDPIPKEIMRTTAIVRAESESDPRQFDVQVGLDEITARIYSLRDTHPSYLELHNLISVRRGGRGQKRPISPESYLLLSETLFDLCSLGELVVPNGAQVARAVPAVENAGHEPSLIPVSLVIRADGRIAGKADEVRATIEEATLNAKWRRTPTFVLQMQELSEIEASLTEIGEDQSPRARLRRTDLIDRQTRIRSVVPLIDLGLGHLVMYQACLLPPDNYPTRYTTTLAKVMGLFVGRCFNWNARGGMLQAWTEWDEGRFVVGFSLPSDDLDEYLIERFGDDNPLSLAAENQPITTLSPQMIAQYFIPELILEFVVREIHRGFKFESSEQKEYLLSIRNWRVGVH